MRKSLAYKLHHGIEVEEKIISVNLAYANIMHNDYYIRVISNGTFVHRSRGSKVTPLKLFPNFDPIVPVNILMNIKIHLRSSLQN